MSVDEDQTGQWISIALDVNKQKCVKISCQVTSLYIVLRHYLLKNIDLQIFFFLIKYSFSIQIEKLSNKRFCHSVNRQKLKVLVPPLYMCDLTNQN